MSITDPSTLAAYWPEAKDDKDAKYAASIEALKHSVSEYSQMAADQKVIAILRTEGYHKTADALLSIRQWHR